MFRKLTGLVAVAAAVVATALLVPAAALACSGTSAVCIYSPGSVGPGGGHSHGAGNPGGAGQTEAPVPVSTHVTGAISQARIPQTDKKALGSFASNPAFGKTRGLSSISPESVVAPSTIGAALDLGPGPIALIAVLAASALLLLGTTGWRGWRRWRRPLGG